MPKLFVLVGLPGSGKSTWILSNCQDADWHSSDCIREELFGSQEFEEGASQGAPLIYMIVFAKRRRQS